MCHPTADSRGGGGTEAGLPGEREEEGGGEGGGREGGTDRQTDRWMDRQ